MLNPDSKLIYDILRSLTGDDDVYKIIEADEVVAKLPEGKEFTKVQLSQIIRELKDREYINVKYFTPDEYCLLTTNRFDDNVPVATAVAVELEPEQAVKVKGERVPYGKKKAEAQVGSVKKGIVFLMAFWGALLGSAVVAAIAIVLEKFVF